MTKPTDDKHSPRILNRRATHDYQITEKLECGIVLRGSEVKSIRQGLVSLQEGFAMIDPNTHQFTLFNVEIRPYNHAGPSTNHEGKRARTLLAHKRQIYKLEKELLGKGSTIVPLAMYFVRGKVKIEVGVGTGKKEYDKRADLKKRDAERDMRRAMSKPDR
jgi:SsrA-binding protein